MKKIPSRAERRRTARTSAPMPSGRDPMMSAYAGLALVVAGIFAAFGIMQWQQHRAISATYATSSPSAFTTSRPIWLADRGTLGSAAFTAGPTQGSDTATGGHGEPVDGIRCEAMERMAIHVHSHLALFVRGKQVAIPRYIGMAPTEGGGCFYWVHTHSAQGIIHVEAPEPGNYTIGSLFDIWGEALSRTGIAGFAGPVVAFVNGVRYDGHLSDIPLTSHAQIVLEVGQPIVAPPNYALPPGE